MKDPREFWDDITEEEMDALLQGVDEEMLKGNSIHVEKVKRKFEVGTGLKLEKKTVLKKGPMKILTLAASVMLVFVLLYTNVSHVRAAIERILSFVPGHGIVETGGQEALGGKDLQFESKDPTLTAKAPIYVQGQLQFEFSRSRAGSAGVKEDYELPSFEVFVNGKKVTGQVSGSAVGSDIEETFWVFTKTPVAIHDQVSLQINGGEIIITSTMVEPDQMSPDGMAHQSENGITIFAQGVKEDGKEKIYLYANADFSSSDVDLYAPPLGNNEEGYKNLRVYTIGQVNGEHREISYKPIESYGTMSRPPLVLNENIQEGYVQISSVLVTTVEDVSVKVPIPEKEEELFPDIPFELGMSKGLVKRVYWSKDGFIGESKDNTLAIEVQFHSNKGIIVEGITDENAPGSASENDKITLYAEPSFFSRTHTMSIKWANYRIPVDMEIPVAFNQ